VSGIRDLAVGALLAAPFLFPVLACSGQPPAPAPAESSYTVAAEILEVSAPDAPRREVLLAHDAVPDFVDIDGKVVGMAAMTMPFPVAPSVDLGAYQPADRVRATFVVRFHGSPAYEVTRLEKISPPP
jgi:Cu/Ag efflux protein CusF